MITGFFRKMMTADAMGILLFITSLRIMTYGVTASLPNVDTKYFFWTCLVSAFISYWLGKGKWKKIQASAGIAVLGVLLTWILGANLGRPILTFGRQVIQQIIHSLQTGQATDTKAIVESWAVIADSSSALLTRLQAWILGLYQGVFINDPLISSIVWVLILWFISAWMGWFAEKRNAMASLLPAAFLLAMVTSYSEHKIDSLWLLIMTLLPLMGIWNYRNRMDQWKKRHFDYSESVRVDTAQAVIFLTLTIGTAAVITPSISWQDIVNHLHERQANEAAEMLGVKNPTGGSQPVGPQKPVLPRDHLLGGSRENSEDIVMIVRTDELLPTADQSLEINAPRYYWRSTVYDEYVGAGWATNAAAPQKISAGTPLIPGILKGYRAIHLDMNILRPRGKLFWSGILFRADIPLMVNWRVKPTSSLFADQTTLLQADMFAASSAATSYQEDVYVPTPTIEELRNASTVYPEEIQRRYLALPYSLPERVRTLAQEITNGISNPYDKVKAIERYLRINYPYDLEIPPPPEGQDVVDYFLFDLRRGYCDYYATSMVVLTRSVGIPARFVSGYAPGTYDVPNGQYIIRELDAHSWAEFYFPEIGWVEFEPTASQPEIERPEEIEPMLEDQKNEVNMIGLLAQLNSGRKLIWTASILGILFIILVYFVFIEKWMYLRLIPEVAVEKIYQRFYQIGRPIAGEWVGAETSSEYLTKLTNNIDRIKFPSNWFLNFVDKFKDNAASLTELYQSTLFTDRHTTKQDAKTTWVLWIRLRLQVYIARFNLLLWGNRTDVK